MYPYLPERVMRPFGYLHIILYAYYSETPYEPASPIVHHKALDAILDDFESYMVP